MSLRRRTLLAGTVALLAPLAGGTSGRRSDRPRLDLVLRNYTDERQPLQVEALRTDGSADEPTVLEREFEVPPASDGEAAGTVRRSDALPSRQLLVRVRLTFGRGTWNDHHHVPAGGGDESIDIGVYRDEDTDVLHSRFR